MTKIAKARTEWQNRVMTKRQKLVRVAVLLGGISSERSVSLQSGREVLRHLPEQYIGKAYDPKKDLPKLFADAKAGKIDIAFNALHGPSGEDGRIQGFLDTLGIPSTGSGVLASALAMDKSMAKRVYNSDGIPSPRAVQIKAGDWKHHKEELLKLISHDIKSPIVVKPNSSGSSVAITVKPIKADWSRAISKALKEDGKSCLVEAFHKGRELTIPILEKKGIPRALPVIEIRTKRTFFDYEAKYEGASEEICPAPIPEEVRTQAQNLALDAHAVLGCKGYSRTDIIWQDSGLFVLETNTLPGLTKMSLFPQSAKVAGITFAELLDQILQEGLRA